MSSLPDKTFLAVEAIASLDSLLDEFNVQGVPREFVLLARSEMYQYLEDGDPAHVQKAGELTAQGMLVRFSGGVN